MSDLISRSALKEKSRRCFVDGFHGSGLYGEIEIVTIEDISLAPAVDAVKVVRCKDCKHFTEDPLVPGYWVCVRRRASRMEPDDFCSYGERKTDG